MPPPKSPSDDDLTLWQLAMRDVKRIFGTTEDEKPVIRKASPPAPRPFAPAAEIPFAPAFGLKLPQEPISPDSGTGGIDRRTEDKFRKGLMRIEARLDLHGLTLRQAEPAVRDFIKLQHGSGRRCLLIITGKGQGVSGREESAWYDSPKGQIRRSLNHWLDAPDLKPLILSIAPAQRQHGGTGAFYILLRRKR